MNNSQRAALSVMVGTLEGIRDDLETMRDAEQDKFDNMPESLQQSERGQVIENAATNLSDALENLNDFIEHLENARDGTY